MCQIPCLGIIRGGRVSLLASGKDRQIILLTKRAITEGYGKSCRVVLLFSVCANYSIIIKSKVQELRELRVWPSMGSWEVFAEEETSELGFKE